MTTTTIQEAKEQLVDLIRRARDGEEIVIAENGQPVARLVPLSSDVGKRTHGGWEGRVWFATDDGGRRIYRRPGSMEGEIWIADDFDELPEDLLRAFEGEDDEPPA